MLLFLAMTERRSLALVATVVTLGRLVGGVAGAVAATAAYKAAVAAMESAATASAVGGTGAAAAGRTAAAAAGAGLVRERIFLLSSHSSRLLLFLSLLFAFAGRFFPCL